MDDWKVGGLMKSFELPRPSLFIVCEVIRSVRWPVCTPLSGRAGSSSMTVGVVLVIFIYGCGRSAQLVV